MSLREGLYGRKLLLCSQIMSTLFYYQQLCLTPRNLPNGLGALTLLICTAHLNVCGSRRTKKKDIFVISTPQRPVPLEHFLYAKHETYKIVDAARNFLPQGCAFIIFSDRWFWSQNAYRYKDAGEALRRKQDKEREAAGLPPVQRVGARGAASAQRGQQRGGSSGRGGGQRGSVPSRGGWSGGTSFRTTHTAADKNLYVHLLGHLKKKGLLPVVVFTFSKKRCEENAATLTNSDLCSSVEKSEVHVAIEKALSRLKGKS